MGSKQKSSSNNLLLKAYRIFKKISVGIVVFQLIFALIVLFYYFSSGLYAVYPPKKLIATVNEKQKKVTDFDITKIPLYLDVTLKGFIYSFKSNNLPQFNVLINLENLAILEAQRRKKLGLLTDVDVDLKTMVDASAIIDGNNYKIRLRVKGDRTIHYNNSNSTSYKIDLEDENVLWGMEEFSVQKPITRNYVYELIFQRLNQHLNNLSLDYRILNFKINGMNKGVYVLEEGISKELILKNSLENGPIYGLEESLSGYYPNVVYDAYSQDYWLEEDKKILLEGYSILNDFRNGDSRVAESLDWESWAKYFAIADILGAYHGAIPKSVKIYYNPSTSKMYPISFDGHVDTEDFSDFILMDFLGTKPKCSYICRESEWFNKFLVDEKGNIREQFIEPYLKYLKIVSSKKFLDKFLEKYKEEIEDFNVVAYSENSKSDKIFWKGLAPYVYNKNYLYERAKIIKSRLSSGNSKFFIFSLEKNYLFTNSTHSKVPAKIMLFCDGIKKEDLWVFGEKKISIQKNCNIGKLETPSGEKKIIQFYFNPTFATKKTNGI